jgi:hypothetical protein
MSPINKLTLDDRETTEQNMPSAEIVEMNRIAAAINIAISKDIRVFIFKIPERSKMIRLISNPGSTIIVQDITILIYFPKSKIPRGTLFDRMSFRVCCSRSPDMESYESNIMAKLVIMVRINTQFRSFER